MSKEACKNVHCEFLQIKGKFRRFLELEGLNLRRVGAGGERPHKGLMPPHWLHFPKQLYAEGELISEVHRPVVIPGDLPFPPRGSHP